MRHTLYFVILAVPLFFSTLMQTDSCKSGKGDSQGASKQSPTTELTSPEPTSMPSEVTTPNAKGVAPGNRLAPGTWGGLHVIMEVSDNGATFQFDCAHGVVSPGISLDSNGHFDIAGTYVREGPGPIREGQNRTANARYSGTVESGKMLLKVKLDNADDSNDFSLTEGKQGKVWKCY